MTKVDLSLFFLKTAQFNTDKPEEFAKYLSEVVMNKIENKRKQIKEAKELENRIQNGELDQYLHKDSLLMKQRKKGSTE